MIHMSEDLSAFEGSLAESPAIGLYNTLLIHVDQEQPTTTKAGLSLHNKLISGVKITRITAAQYVSPIYHWISEPGSRHK